MNVNKFTLKQRQYLKLLFKSLLIYNLPLSEKISIMAVFIAKYTIFSNILTILYRN